jgi:hypothetical protein
LTIEKITSEKDTSKLLITRTVPAIADKISVDHLLDLLTIEKITSGKDTSKLLITRTVPAIAAFGKANTYISFTRIIIMSISNTMQDRNHFHSLKAMMN